MMFLVKSFADRIRHERISIRSSQNWTSPCDFSSDDADDPNWNLHHLTGVSELDGQTHRTRA
jgi:hypothetical protein